MRYLDRHRLSLLVEYASLAKDAEREPSAAEAVSLFVRVAFDQATASGRAAFVTATEALPGEWPWTAVKPVDLDIDSDDGLVASLSYAPPALILLATRDVAEADMLDPGNVVGDEHDGGALLGALQRWEPKTILASISPDGWTKIEVQPTVQPDPVPEPVGQEPEPPPADEPAPQTPEKGPQAPEPVNMPEVPLYHRWQFWAGVGVVSVAAVGVAMRRSRALPAARSEAGE